MKQTVVILLLVIAASCQKTPSNREADERPFYRVGELHNQLLEKLYGEFKSGSIHSHGSYKAAMANLMRNPVGRINGKAPLSVEMEVFTSKVQVAINEDRNLDQLLREFLSTCEVSLDRHSAIAMVSVAKASMEYWTPANMQKWQALGNGRSSMARDIAKGAVFADCKGAVKGAVAGAIAGAAGGTVTLPVIGTVAGAAGVGLTGMVFGAVSSSVEHVLTDLIKDWIGWSVGSSCGTAWAQEQPNTFTDDNPCPMDLQDSLDWARAHPVSMPDSLTLNQ